MDCTGSYCVWKPNKKQGKTESVQDEEPIQENISFEFDPSSSTPHVRMASDVEIQGDDDDNIQDEESESDFANSSACLPRRVFGRRRTRQLSMLQEEHFCYRYLPVHDCARNIVNNIIKQATMVINEDESEDQLEPTLDDIKDQYNVNIWPSVGEFTKDNGVEAIETYLIYSCRLQEDWSYKIILIKTDVDCFNQVYLYEVKFSLPTRMYPVAQATVSLYFRIEVCKSLPPACPVKVSFQLEGLSHKFDPFQYILNDKMLLRIIQVKLKIFKRFKF